MVLSTEILTNPDQWLAFLQLNFLSRLVCFLRHHHYAGSGIMVEDIYGEAKAIDEDGGGDGIW